MKTTTGPHTPAPDPRLRRPEDRPGSLARRPWSARIVGALILLACAPNAAAGPGVGDHCWDMGYYIVVTPAPGVGDEPYCLLDYDCLNTNSDSCTFDLYLFIEFPAGHVGRMDGWFGSNYVSPTCVGPGTYTWCNYYLGSMTVGAGTSGSWGCGYHSGAATAVRIGCTFDPV